MEPPLCTLMDAGKRSAAMQVVGSCSSPPWEAWAWRRNQAQGRLSDLPKAMTGSVAERISNAVCLSGRAGLLEC